MCELVSQIYRSGKEVYIVSDTYYTKEQLENLLDKFKVKVTDIFASCEFETSKTQELYSHLKNCIGGRTCLHIGDDGMADVDCAVRFGLDACKIFSGLELLEAAGYMGMWDCIESLSDRIKVGMFVATIFNSPFQFEAEERKIAVKTAQDIGYLFAAPVITDFVIWFEQMVQQYKLTNVWMGARDGYLLKRLYDYLKQEEASTYFMTSRTAAIRAGMQSTDDIKYVADMNFTGSLEKQLAVRFGMEIEATGKDSLLDFQEEIL
jgi:predicted HAD superfamily hydrolase